jgi:pilus assembly protein CpaF
MIQATPSLIEHPLHGAVAESAELKFQQLKCEIHEELVESLDLSLIGQLDRQALEPEVHSLAAQLCRVRAAHFEPAARERLLVELMHEVFGMGPIEMLMHDDEVADILVNNAHEVYVERRGRLELTGVLFADDQHVMRVIQRIVARIGRRIDEVTPMVDARLPDGSRLNAIVPPLAIKGPTMSIRRFGKRPLEVEDLLDNGSLPHDVVQFLSAAVEARISFLISGGTGAGKTTMLNALSAYIPHDERLVTIEDSAELKLQHPHVIALETRISNTEGAGEVTQRDLVRNSLRMRPDRILCGEVRGAEALDMLQAMNTGHEGSLTTIHANDTRDALARLEMMVAMTGFELPVPVVRQYIAAGIKLVVHLARLKGGVRKVTRVSEIVGVVDGMYQLEDMFVFEQSGVDERGVAAGRFRATGYRPRCLDRLRSTGVNLNEALFAARTLE